MQNRSTCGFVGAAARRQGVIYHPECFIKIYIRSSLTDGRKGQSAMQYSNVIPGRFVSRPNRFLAQVKTADGVQTCHVKNTGRCAELLLPGAPVWLQRFGADAKRKTKFDLIAVQKGALLLNIDSQAPNAAAREFLASGGLGWIPSVLRPEYTWGDSRFDFYLEHGGRRCLAEVKGVTLEEDGTALFPDAPTLRGIKHLEAHAPCFRRRLARRTGRRSTRIGLRLRRHTGVHGPARARPRHRALKNAPPISVLPVPASGRQKPRPQRPFGRRGRGCFLSFILRCARFFALRPFSAWYKAGCPGTGYTARRTHCCAWHRRPGSHRWG